MIDLITSLLIQYWDWYLGISFIWFLGAIDDLDWIDISSSLFVGLFWPIHLLVSILRYFKSS